MSISSNISKNKITRNMAVAGLVAGLSGVFSAPAMADKLMYAGGGLGLAELGDDNDVTMPYGRFGMYINENFSGEVRAGIGLDDDGVELDTLLGGYVRGGIPLSDVFFPYAIAGITMIDYSYDNGPFNDSGDEMGISMGIGADFNINERMKINAEYINYVDDDDAELDALGVGLAVNF